MPNAVHTPRLAIALLATLALAACSQGDHAATGETHSGPSSSSAGLPSGHVMAGEQLAKAKGKATGQSCIDCHGADGNAPIDPTYPKLGGQYADYIAHALQAAEVCGLRDAWRATPGLFAGACVVALIWFAIAARANRWIVDRVTGAHEVTRKEQPRLWNLLENLCISRGMRLMYSAQPSATQSGSLWPTAKMVSFMTSNAVIRIADQRLSPAAGQRTHERIFCTQLSCFTACAPSRTRSGPLPPQSSSRL